MRPLLLSAATALALSPAPLPAAGSFLAVNGMIVRDLGGGRFAVPWSGKSGAVHFWCAAGDYVIRGLGRPRSTRIWRISPPPRRAGEGITFSLSSEGATARTGMSVIPDDGSLSAAFAQALCDEELRIPDID